MFEKSKVFSSEITFIVIRNLEISNTKSSLGFLNKSQCSNFLRSAVYLGCNLTKFSSHLQTFLSPKILSKKYFLITKLMRFCNLL